MSLTSSLKSPKARLQWTHRAQHLLNLSKVPSVIAALLVLLRVVVVVVGGAFPHFCISIIKGSNRACWIAGSNITFALLLSLEWFGIFLSCWRVSCLTKGKQMPGGEIQVQKTRLRKWSQWDYRDWRGTGGWRRLMWEHRVNNSPEQSETPWIQILYSDEFCWHLQFVVLWEPFGFHILSDLRRVWFMWFIQLMTCV